MATPKKNTTTKDALHALPIALKSSNGDEFPIAYCDNIWDIVAAQSKLIGVLGSIGQYDQHSINEALAELAIPIVEANLEYNLSIELRRKDGSIRDEIANITTQLVDFDFANSVVPNVNFARIKVNTTINLTLTQHSGTQSATYHTESHGLFSKMIATMDGVSGEGVWVRLTIPAYEYYEFPTNIEIVGVSGQYILYNDFGMFFNELYKKADKEDCASQADIDYLQAAIEGVDSSIPQNVSDLQDSDDYVKGSDLATVATSGSYDDLNDKPSIPENISDLNNDSNFVESSDLATVATSGSYEDLNDKPEIPDPSEFAQQADIDYIVADIDDLKASILNCAKHYVFVCKNYAETTSATILAENHGCGLYPIVSCYSGGQQVAVDIALNEYGDITVGWKNAADVTPQNPMTISVVGASEITAVEEEQPTPPIPDSTDYPYLVFTKTGDGECEVRAASTFNVENLVIPAAVILNGEELAVTSIRNNAFQWKDVLLSVVIPNSVTAIGNSAFANCSNLASVELPNTLTSIGEFVFDTCALTTINIPYGITTIGYGMFTHNSLTAVNIPRSVTTIDTYAFSSNSSLASVTIPNSVTTINENAFAYCGNQLKVYCEAASKPNGWNSAWKGTGYGNGSVYWGQTMPE